MEYDGSLFRYPERTVTDDAWPIFVPLLKFRCGLCLGPAGPRKSQIQSACIRGGFHPYRQYCPFYRAALRRASAKAENIWLRIWPGEYVPDTEPIATQTPARIASSSLPQRCGSWLPSKYPAHIRDAGKFSACHRGEFGSSASAGRRRSGGRITRRLCSGTIRPSVSRIPGSRSKGLAQPLQRRAVFGFHDQLRRPDIGVAPVVVRLRIHERRQVRRRSARHDERP